MKTRNLLFPVLLVLTAIVIQSSISPDVNSRKDEIFTIPENVKAVMDNKCFGCHNVDAQSDKSKDKLMIDKLNELPKTKLIKSLGEIGDVVSKGEMPPKKFLEQKPEKKLTEDEQKLIVEWSEQAADDLLK